MTDSRQLVRKRVGLESLICLHVIACCVSLACVATIYPQYHLHFRPAELAGAAAVIAAFALISILFIFSEFSFGFFVGFYFFTMVTGYLWLNTFSEFDYNHRLTGLSAAAAAIAFLLPALLVTKPLKTIWMPSVAAFDRLLNGILVLSVATFAAGAAYNFNLAPLNKLIALDSDIYVLRDSLQFPTILNYLFGMVTGALLPFAFACFLERRNFWRAGMVLALILLFHPILLSKTVLLSSAWLVAMATLSRLFEVRVAVVLSLLAPLIIGLVFFVLFRIGAIPERAMISYFSLINFRMITIPSMAMDYYNEFFSKNDLTHFCQIGLLKRLMPCPYQEPLGQVIYNAFRIGGNFNASLFATEGIASVGPMFAPVTALVGGMVIALANRMSAGLPPRFILVSGAVIPHILLNVPFTVVMLTHGAAVLFLLWYVTPRAMFRPTHEQTDQPGAPLAKLTGAQ
ncbi:MAG: hypothetical protein U1E61_11195 [Bradyrhizobium sp.]